MGHQFYEFLLRILQDLEHTRVLLRFRMGIPQFDSSSLS
jgi:hypothetical protein